MTGSTYKYWFRRLFLIFILIAYSFMGYQAYTIDDTYKTEIISNGLIQSKKSEDYSCGKNGNKTCTEYFFIVDGKQNKVSEETFYSYHTNEYVKLTKQSRNVEPTLVQHISCVLIVISLFIATLISCITFVVCCYWSFRYSDEKTFKEYLDE